MWNKTTNPLAFLFVARNKNDFASFASATGISVQQSVLQPEYCYWHLQ